MSHGTTLDSSREFYGRKELTRKHESRFAGEVPKNLGGLNENFPSRRKQEQSSRPTENVESIRVLRGRDNFAVHFRNGFQRRCEAAGNFKRAIEPIRHSRLLDSGLGACFATAFSKVWAKQTITLRRRSISQSVHVDPNVFESACEEI